MGLQEYVNKSIQLAREERMRNSDQLTLGELIERITKIKEKYKEEKDEPIVKYDFEYLFPTELMSWRGSYAELALNFETTGKYMSVSAFLKMLQDAVGATFEGYKGGDFVMNENTPIWVANYGNSGNTAIIDVLDSKYCVTLITGLREF
jgi:hypothetical protein